MAYENLTTFTEVDAGGYYSQTTVRNTGTLVASSPDVYVYKDYGVTYFGDYTMNVDIKLTAHQPGSYLTMWAVSNTLGNAWDFLDGQAIYFSKSGVQYKLWLEDYETWNSDTADVDINTTYYLTISRSGTTATCKIYTDSARTTLLDTLTITCGNATLRYLYAGASLSGDNNSGWSENFDLNPPLIIQKNILFNLQKKLSISKDILFSFIQTYYISNNLKANLKKEISDTYNIGAVLAKEDIYDFDTDIRWKKEEKTNIGFALSYAETPQPAGLDAIKVYVNSVLLDDVDTRTVEWSWVMNDRPGTCSFLVARKFDKFNNELDGSSSSLAVNQIIEIKFNGVLKFYGYIVNLDVSANRETVIVRGLDRKYKIAKELCSIDYGRHSESGYDSTGSMLTYILDDLVTKGYISSYTGIPTGMVTELREQDGVPYGMLITELLDQSGNYKWNVTPGGVLNIYEQGNGVLKEISYQESSRQIGLYDVIDCRFTMNDISNMITTAEVVMGTESVETYSSYNRRFLRDAYLSKAWSSNQESAAKTEYLLNLNMVMRGMLVGNTTRVSNALMDVWRRYSIPGWTEGSFIDPTVKPFITRDAYNVTVSGFYTRKYVHTYAISWRSYGGDWSIENGYVRFSMPQVKATQTNYDIISDLVDTIHLSSTNSPRITMAFFKKETLIVATYPTIFDVTYIGSGGVGYKRRLIFAGLGIAFPVYWNEYLDNVLVWHYKPGYNDTAYATDRAKLFLSRVNDPITQGNFAITFDAQDYYGIDLGKKVNIINTEDVGIYRNTNGFPIDVEEIRFDAGNYLCTVSGRNRRFYVCSMDMPERQEAT